MIFEVKLNEEMIRKIIEDLAHCAVIDYLKSYGFEDEVQRAVRKYWDESVQAIIVEELKNSNAIRKKVREAIKRRLQAQITKLMKDKA